MWQTNSLWFEVAIVSTIIALGHICLGHFEERTPVLKKLLKYLLTLVLVVGISIYFGRTIAFSLLGLLFLPVIYIHAIWLPSRGINGCTGEPKERYYELRGWKKPF